MKKELTEEQKENVKVRINKYQTIYEDQINKKLNISAEMTEKTIISLKTWI